MKKLLNQAALGLTMVIAGITVARCGRNDTPVTTVARPTGTTGPTSQALQSDTDDTAAQLAKLDRIPNLGMAKAKKMPDGQMWDVYANGLGVQMIKPGIAGPPRTGMKVSVNYVGTIPSTGEVFDRSPKDQPFEFTLASKGIIKGWNEAVAAMNVGTKERIWVPADLAYGERGSPPKIGPNQPLIFEIELLRTAGAGVDFPAEPASATAPAAQDVVNGVIDDLTGKIGPTTKPGQKN